MISRCNGKSSSAFIKRRLLLVLGVVFGLLIAGSVGYVLRMRQVEKRVVLSRAQGMDALARGEYSVAYNKIGSYLQRHPDDPVGIYSYALAREHIEAPNGKHLTEAISHLEHALSLKPDYMDARRALLDLYLQVHFNTEAIGTADTILASVPGDVPALRAKAMSLSRMGKPKEALEAARTVCDVNPTDIEAQVLLFHLMLQNDKPASDVEAYADTLVKAHDADARFELLRSIAALSARDLPHAIEWAKKSEAHPISDPTYVTMLIKHLDDLGQFDDSLAILSKFAGATTTADPKLRALLVLRLWQGGNYQGAIDLTANEQPADPKADDAILAGRALALADIGRHDDATAVVQAISDHHHEASVTWAPVLTAVKGNPRATDANIIIAGHTALDSAPDNAYFHYFLAEAYARQGEDETAVAQWRLAASLSRSWAAPAIEASRALTRLGRIVEAMQYAQVGRERAPHDIDGLAAIGAAWSHVIMNSDATAKGQLLQLVTDVQTQKPGEPTTLPIQIRMLAVTGQPKDAASRIDAVLHSATPPSEEVLSKLVAISVESKLGMEDPCYAAWEKAYGVTPDLAFTKATNLLRVGKADEGRRLLDAAAKGGKPGKWAMTQAHYLDLMGSPDAKAIWVTLGIDNPTDVPLQWDILSSPFARTDHMLIGTVLDRIKAVVGDKGLTWRLARAGWLLQGTPAEKDLTEASLMLNDVVRTSGDLLAPRLMLGQCLEKLGDANGAFEQYSKAASLHPESNGAQLEAARILQARGDFSGADPYIERVAASTTAAPDELRLAATMLAREGNPTRALELVQKADSQPGAHSPEEARLTARMRADLYRAQNQFDKADAIYSELLKTPDVPTIEAAVESYSAEGKTDEAAKTLDLLDKTTAPPGTKNLIRADLLRRHGDVAGSLAEYQRGTQAAPTNLNAWRQYVITATLLGQADQAISAARDAGRANPGDPGFAAVIQRADLIKSLANDPAAGALFNALMSGDAESITVAGQALDVLGTSARDHKSPRSLTDALRQLADTHPRVLALQECAAQKCIGLGQFDDAITLATRAMQTFPTDPNSARLAAEALAAAGRWAEVPDVAQAWRNRNPESPIGPDMMLAMADLQLSLPDQAETLLKPYLDRAKAAPDTYHRIIALTAHARLATGHPDTAAELLLPLIAKSAPWRREWILLTGRIADPGSAANWLNQLAPSIPKDSAGEAIELAEAWNGTRRGENSPNTGAFRQALAAATTESETASDVTADALVHLGMLHELNKDLKSAEAVYRHALKIAPNNPLARNNLASVIGQSGGNLHEAIDLVSGSIAAYPDVPNFYDTLATLQSQSSKFTDAATTIGNAIRLDPNNVEWQVNLTEILLKSGDKDKAKTAWKSLEARDVNPTSLDPDLRGRFTALKTALQ